MGSSSKPNNQFICHDCFRLKACKDTAMSWIFFMIALIATISIRAVNVVLDYNPLLAKLFWYLGVGGFFLFFIYKFRNNAILHKELERSHIVKKVFSKDNLSDHDYGILGSILCQVSSKKDKINYFFIFFFSGLALALAIYVDFFKN